MRATVAKKLRAIARTLCNPEIPRALIPKHKGQELYIAVTPKAEGQKPYPKPSTWVNPMDSFRGFYLYLKDLTKKGA